jgi:hypothetical protein
VGQDGTSPSSDLPDGLSEIFFREGLDRKSGEATDLPVGQNRRPVRQQDCRAPSTIESVLGRSTHASLSIKSYLGVGRSAVADFAQEVYSAASPRSLAAS